MERQASSQELNRRCFPISIERAEKKSCGTRATGYLPVPRLPIRPGYALCVPSCPLHQSARDGFRASCSVFSAYCPLMCTVFVCTHLSASLLVNALIFLDFTSFQILKQVLAIPPALSCSHGHEEASSTAEGFFPQWRGPHTLLSIRVGFLVPSTIG